MTRIVILLLAISFPLPALGQYVTGSRNFSLGLQQAAVRATVRIPSHGGTGVIIGQDPSMRTYILTAAHVLDRPNASIDLFNGRNGGFRLWSQTILARNQRTDLALLRIQLDVKVQVLPVCPTELSPNGSYIPTLSVGCDGMRSPYCWTCYSNFDSDRKWVLTRRAPHNGRSGGPLVDKYGFVVGICSRTTVNRGRDIPPGYYCRPRAIRDLCEEAGEAWLFQQHPAIIARLRQLPSISPLWAIPNRPYMLPFPN